EVYDRLDSTGTFGRSQSTVWKVPYIDIKLDILRAARGLTWTTWPSRYWPEQRFKGQDLFFGAARSYSVLLSIEKRSTRLAAVDADLLAVGQHRPLEPDDLLA